MKKYRVGFCGTQSVGKSSLVKALSQLPEFKGFYVATERSKYLRDLGVPLNTDSTVLGQLIFAAERSSELIHDNLLTDRTIWDVCAFTEEAKSISRENKDILLNNLYLLSDYYDVVFYIDPEGIPIEDNGVRTTDPEYRDRIDKTIKRLLELKPPKNLVLLRGTTEERIKVVLDAMKNHIYGYGTKNK